MTVLSELTIALMTIPLLLKRRMSQLPRGGMKESKSEL